MATDHKTHLKIVQHKDFKRHHLTVWPQERPSTQKRKSKTTIYEENPKYQSVFYHFLLIYVPSINMEIKKN